MWGISVASGTPAFSAARAGARVRMSLTTAWGRVSSSNGSSARAASPAWLPSSESGSGGGNIRYSSAGVKPRPAPSTASRRSSQLSSVTWWPRSASARPRAIAGKTWPASPNAASSSRMLGAGETGPPLAGLGAADSLTGPGEDDLGHMAVARGAQQEADRLADVLGLDHLLSGHLALGELGHRRVDEGRREGRALDPFGAGLAVRALGEVDHRRLRRRVDREPPLSRLAGDRGGVDEQRLAVLGPRLAQHRQALAGADDQRPQIDAELHVEVLGLDLGHR